jgi:hypothetical protein
VNYVLSPGFLTSQLQLKSKNKPCITTKEHGLVALKLFTKPEPNSLFQDYLISLLERQSRNRQLINKRKGESYNKTLFTELYFPKQAAGQTWLVGSSLL